MSETHVFIVLKPSFSMPSDDILPGSCGISGGSFRRRYRSDRDDGDLQEESESPKPDVSDE